MGKTPFYFELFTFYFYIMIKHPWHNEHLLVKTSRVHQWHCGNLYWYAHEVWSGQRRPVYSSWIAYCIPRCIIQQLWISSLKTLCDDHDPLDIMVLCREPIQPLCLVPARVIGWCAWLIKAWAMKKFLLLLITMLTPTSQRHQELEAISNWNWKSFSKAIKDSKQIVTVPDFQDKQIPWV